MIPPAEPLVLRFTVIGGETRADDYQVIWNGFSIGRVMKQTGMPPGRPDWSWSIIFPHRPQQAWQRGMVRDLEEAKQRFKLAWTALHRELTEADVTAAIEQKASDADRPWNRRPR